MNSSGAFDFSIIDKTNLVYSMIVNVYKFGGDIGVMKSFKGEDFACGGDKSQPPFHRPD